LLASNLTLDTDNLSFPKIISMWQPIKDCGKQLNVNFRIRQTVNEEDAAVSEYKIEEIETGNYHLKLVSKTKNGQPVVVDPAEAFVLNEDQIMKYNFEVWTEAGAPVH
jgi:hypothetical protein